VYNFAAVVNYGRKLFITAAPDRGDGGRNVESVWRFGQLRWRYFGIEGKEKEKE
jgi:hypothetical protein